MNIQGWLDVAHQVVDIADIAVEVERTGTPSIYQALIQAEIDPTAAAVEWVFEQYRRAGVIPPARLVAHLLLINEQRHPEDTVRGDLTPWLIAGAIGLYLLFRKRR